MARKSKQRSACALLVLLATAQTPASSPPPNAYVGIQGLVLTGVHRDAAGSQYGVGAGALLQVHAGGSRVAVNLEGIPVIGIPGVKPSVAYGQATPSLGIFNGQLEYALDPNARIWIGAGETIYNQRTPLPAIGQVVSSRLAGVRYAVRYRAPTRSSHFVEALFGTAPILTGSDVYTYRDGQAPAIEPERASEIDASLAFGYRQNASEWLVGVRDLDFAAEFIDTGAGADRNVGIGPMIEWRHLLK